METGIMLQLVGQGGQTAAFNHHGNHVNGTFQPVSNTRALVRVEG